MDRIVGPLTEGLINKYVSPSLNEYFSYNHLDNNDVDGEPMYQASSYYGTNYSGLEDSAEFDNFDEMLDWVWEHLSKGGYIEATSSKGYMTRISPDEFDFESDGDPHEFLMYKLCDNEKRIKTESRKLNNRKMVKESLDGDFYEVFAECDDGNETSFETEDNIEDAHDFMCSYEGDSFIDSCDHNAEIRVHANKYVNHEIVGEFDFSFDTRDLWESKKPMSKRKINESVDEKLAVYSCPRGEFAIYGDCTIEQDTDDNDEPYNYAEFDNLSVKEIKDGVESPYTVTGTNWAGRNFNEQDVIENGIEYAILGSTVEMSFTNDKLTSLINEYKNDIIEAGGKRVPRRILHGYGQECQRALLITDKFVYYGYYDSVSMFDVDTMELVSDNNFAEDGFMESVENIQDGNEKYLWSDIPYEEFMPYYTDGEMSEAMKTNKRKINENANNSRYFNKIGEFFDYTGDFDFLDLVDNLVDRVDDFNDEEDVMSAMDDGLIYTDDLWTIFKFYAGSPDGMTWEEALDNFTNDFLSLCSQLADGGLEESCNHKRNRKNSLKEGYRGCKNVEMVSNGSWSDPDLVYDGYTFNYWDIEDALWSDFLEDTGHRDNESGDPKVEAEFNKYVQDRCESYLDDCIYGGYFQNGSKSWHDMYEKNESLNKRRYLGRR